MTTVISTTEPVEKHPADDRDYRVDVRKELPSGVDVQTVTATPPVGITIAAEMPTSADYVDDETGETVPAGKAIQFRGSGGTAMEVYDVQFECGLTNGDTIGLNVPVEVYLK